MDTTFKRIRDAIPSSELWTKLTRFHNPNNLNDKIKLEDLYKSNTFAEVEWIKEHVFKNKIV